jgi:hypothetical protein
MLSKRCVGGHFPTPDYELTLLESITLADQKFSAVLENYPFLAPGIR